MQLRLVPREYKARMNRSEKLDVGANEKEADFNMTKYCYDIKKESITTIRIRV